MHPGPARLHLSYGVNVIGFDVQDDERAALSEVARAGKGKYYNAQSAAELIDVVRGLQKELEVVTRPAPVGNKLRLNAARSVEVLPPAIQLPPVDAIYLTPVGTGSMALRVDHIAKARKYGQTLRIPPSVKADKFDVWWVPSAVRLGPGPRPPGQPGRADGDCRLPAAGAGLRASTSNVSPLRRGEQELNGGRTVACTERSRAIFARARRPAVR